MHPRRPTPARPQDQPEDRTRHRHRTALAVLAVLTTAAVLVAGVATRGGDGGAGPTADGGTPAVAREVAATGVAPAANPASTPRARGRFPTGATTGVPRGWSPRRTVRGTLTIDEPGAVVKDVRVLGDVLVTAPDVTLVRVEVRGGVIDNFAGSRCSTGLVLRRVTVRRAPGQVTTGDYPAIGAGGYTARRVKIVGLPEGFRVGGSSSCGPVTIVRSLARVQSPDECGDWHGDALQGYDGGALTVRDSVLEMVVRDGCYGTAPFFYPSGQGNTSVDIDGLVVAGGGYPFRLGTPGTVRGLHVVARSWVFGPIDVACSEVSSWQADVVRLRGGQPVPVRRQACRTDGGA